MRGLRAALKLANVLGHWVRSRALCVLICILTADEIINAFEEPHAIKDDVICVDATKDDTPLMTVLA